MRKHNGMRPQDVAIVLKIIAKKQEPWQNKDLAQELFISPAEISDSLARSEMGGLISSGKKKTVYRQSLMEFIQYGLHHVFPAIPGGMVKGMYTAHSHPFMKKHFQSDLQYVWPDFAAKGVGLSIEPLYKEAVKAAAQDEMLYKMLALIDVIRVGRIREVKVAISELKKMIEHEPSEKHHAH